MAIPWRCGCVWKGSYPSRKDRPISFTFPRVEGAEDLPQALQGILEAVARGEITPGEGNTLTAMLDTYRKRLKTADLEARITALEKEVPLGRY